MDWTDKQKIDWLKECICESKFEISYAKAHGDDFTVSQATEILKLAQSQLEALIGEASE